MTERNDERIDGDGDDHGQIVEMHISETTAVSTDEDTTVIRAEIRETREQLGDTLEEIGSRLNPSHLKNQAKQEIREATIGRVEHMAQQTANRVSDAGESIMDTIRDNPIPAAMVGVGLGWLLWNGRRSAAPSSRTRRTSGPWQEGGNPYTGASRPGGYAGYGGGYGAGADEQRDAADSGLVDGLRDRASDLGDRVQQTAGDLVDRTQQVAGTVADEARQQARRVEDLFHENPLAVGAATLAAGLMVGLAIPESHREQELMGDARDRLADRVRDVAERTGERVQHVAERVLDEAKSTARTASEQEGLTGSVLA